MLYIENLCSKIYNRNADYNHAKYVLFRDEVKTLDTKKRISLTETQKGIYFDCQLQDPIAYHVAATFLLHDLNECQFINALNLLISEQEALRSCIEIMNDLPVLVVYRQIEFTIETQDISSDQLNQINRTKSIVEEEIKQAFDLAKAPLFRCKLLRLDNKQHLFVICMHHLISDGPSIHTFMNKLLSFYHKLLKQEVIVLKNDSGFYNHIVQENKNLLDNKYSKEKEFWVQKMQGVEPLSLHSDYPIKQKNGIGKEMRFIMSADLTQAIQQLSMNQEVTYFMFCLVAFGVLLGFYTQREEIVLSSPFSYRPNLDIEETIGCFIHMLPLRFHIDQLESFASVLQQVSTELILAYKNVHYPTNLIIRDGLSSLNLGTISSIFDLIYVYDVYEDLGNGDVKVELIDQDIVTFPGNLMVCLNKLPNHDMIKIQYKPDVFSEETITLLGKRYLALLKVLVDNINIKIQDICLFLEDEHRQLLSTFNQSPVFTHHPESLINLFTEKVRKYPNRIALITGEKKETYAQINAKVEQLTCRILKRKIKANECVGLQLERSIDLIVGILAILKAGCAYVAIEPNYPKKRKEFIFNDAEISLLLTSSYLPCDYDANLEFLFVDESENDLDIKHLLLEASNPFDLAYIAYTSGSTGNPKGVMIENHSVVNVLLDLERRFPMQEHDVFLLKTPYSFDLSVSELFGWFIGKGSLLISQHGSETDPQLILDEIETYSVTHVNFVPSMFRLFLERLDDKSNLAKIHSLKWIFIGGEKVSTDIYEKFSALNINARLECMYGPTECTLWATHYSIKNFSKKINIPIGQPLNETRCYVVGKNMQLQPIGIPGELCLSGAGLARGYVNLEQMTHEKFVLNPFFKESDPAHYRRMYRTGDLVRWLPCGNLDFLERIDFQVKIRGLRLELEEIETVLAEYEGIIQAVVVVKKEPNKADILCAYYFSDFAISEANLRKYLANILPTYMVPSFFVHKKEWPLTHNGKVDRQTLSADNSYRNNMTPKQIHPKTDLERKLVSIWKETLSINNVGLDDNFFELGGHSLSLIQMNNKIKKSLNLDLPISLHFQLPTVRLLAEYFSKNKTTPMVDRKFLFKRSKKTIYKDIAIIGMSINVPGAQNIYDFWDNLVNERESIHFYQDHELMQLGVPSSTLEDSHYVKARGRLDNIEYFDPTFFDYTHTETRMMSPQLRSLYQGIWAAFEDAGYFPNSDSSKFGLFLGGSDEFEWYKKVLFGSENYVDKYQAFTLSSNHFLATRIAYKLDMKGPAFSALTACSTTLATTHLACQSLILGECDIAIAGGVTIELPNEGGYFYQPGMMFSLDGHCRPFDAKAKGTIFSNGLGLVVLKRLDQAIIDGDSIYAVIKGSAMNNDGLQKLGFTAPSVKGQAEAIQSAYRVANIDPETVSYVEAHGTGTLLGDPIEVNSLTQAFASTQKQFCILGSVKGNIGHTDTAAGIVSLLKVALLLKNQYIPGTVNYEKPNPEIDFQNTPFVVKSKGIEWKKDKKRPLFRAGINAFGVGGTNVHMVLEQAVKLKRSNAPSPFNLLVFSAKSTTALLETSKNVLKFLHKNSKINVSEVAWTLQIARKPFRYRKTLVIDNNFFLKPIDTILSELQQSATHEVQADKKTIYFMFSGQGSQYAGMGRDLYYAEDQHGIACIFRQFLNQVFDLLPKTKQKKYIDIILGNKNPHKINETEFSQFAIFSISYALARTVISLGIKPDGMIGHSIGELTAATIAGIFELKDAVAIVLMRGRIMQKQKPGRLLCVLADVTLVENELDPDLWLALDNTTNNCVVGGSMSAVASFEKKAENLGWVTSPINTSHAFHTPMMQEASSEFQKILATYEMHEPSIPIISNQSGTWATKNEMSCPEYWAEQILRPVNFSKCLAEVLKDQKVVFIELGPSNILCSFANSHISKTSEQHFINLLRHPKMAQNDILHINQKLGELWCHGLEIDWHTLKGEAIYRRVSLPTYSFDKIHFPIDLSTELRVSDEHLPPVLIVENLEHMQKIIIDAYKTVLGLNTISLSQNFFSLGGDSLKAASLIATLNNQLSIQTDIKTIFDNPTPLSLAAHMNSLSHNENFQPTTIRPAPFHDNYPLSSAQTKMYTLYLLEQNSVAYNLPSATLIKGPLNKEHFERTVEKLIERHESLRTVFTIRNNQLIQTVLPNYALPIIYSENSATTVPKRTELIYQFVKPFHFEQGPPFRVELIKFESNEYLLLFDIHHIISDGTSMEIITRDFNQLYFTDLPLPDLHYKDFAFWQNNFLKSNTIKAQEDFWLHTLSGSPQSIELPTDFKRPAIKTFDGDRVYFTLDIGLSEQLINLAQDTGTTLFMLFLTMWNILLARYANQEDIVVGIPVSGRTYKEIEEMVGMFVNMLPMRNFPQNRKKFISFLMEVKENTLNAFKNQDYQFDQLVNQLNLHRNTSRNALFEVCFNYENMKFYELEIEGIRFTPYSFGTKSTVYDLTLTLSENKKQNYFTGYIEYATKLFKRDTIKHMVENFQTLLNCVVKNKEILIEQVDIVSLAQRQLLYEQFNATSLAFNTHTGIHNLFEQNIIHSPDKIALIMSNGKSLTFAELNEKANAVAWHLIERGIEKETIVGIMANRDESLIISLLGVLKAGGAYLPIDPSYPIERISYMLSHCNAQFLISPKQHQNKINFNGYILNPDSCLAIRNNPRTSVNHSYETQLSHIIYTSGSTGKPKAVMIKHLSMINLIQEVRNKKIFAHPEDKMLCMTTISFDIFAFESLIPLCIGNSVYLTDEFERLDPALVGKKIIEHKVTHLFSTPSRLKAFVDNSEFYTALTKLKCIFSGGEHFHPPLLTYLQNHTRSKIYNMYGPTEATIWSTLKELTCEDEINIGSPIANTRAYVLNPGKKLQPIGCYGELYLSGYGIARGYLHDEERTNGKFGHIDEIAPTSIYQTGDKARFLPNGELEISGRLDTQVKLRGYRIELHEIEEVVLQHEAVDQAVAITVEDKKQDQQLALFYCLKNTHPGLAESVLKNWLKEKLPNYMMPTFFIFLDNMPLLPNGKINRKALCLPIEHSYEIEKTEPALTQLENTLLSFWKEHLNLENISIKDNFFDLGGNSLSLIYINNKINTWLERPVSLIKLFEYPTIESLAKYLSLEPQEIKVVVPEQSHANKLPDIAIIGLSCKFPGANNINEFWNNIVSGTETITHFDDEELLNSGIDRTLLTNPQYKKSKGFLNNVEYFDSDFFNYSEQEAHVMDPQSRVLHQCAWEVLEDAGYNPNKYPGKIGLFAGSSSNFLWVKQWIKEDQDRDLLSAFETLTLNEKDFLTTRLSYKLDLKGPSFNIQTACSTSLVAIHQAAQSLFYSESDMVIAGGVSISYPRKEGYLWHEGMIFSQDGHCRPFSDNATGIVPGNGCGLVLLKRLSDALRDQDHIYAVIKGSAMNNDGLEKVGYTAPSINGQRSVIETALKKSGISPEDISYLEAHGTATKIGDPIEIEALTTAWNTNKKNFCAIGSVKANIGHLDAAAGVAGIIKTALLLHHRTVPPHINFENINPLINLQDSPFYINKEAKKIEKSTLIRAGVSAFGIGGTNVHMILEQAPLVVNSNAIAEVNLLIFSARTQESLLRISEEMIHYLYAHPEMNLTDVAWTLQVGRKAFEYRKALVLKGILTQNSQEIADCMKNPGNKIPDSKNIDLIELKQQFTQLLAIKNQISANEFHQTLGQLWCAGLDIDWESLHEGEGKKRISLPTYVFDKKYYQSDIVINETSPASMTTPGNMNVHQHLAKIWLQIFGCETIQETDDFFALGGNSLKAVYLIAQIQKIMKIDISLADVFSHSVFKHMVEQLILHRSQTAYHKITPIMKKTYYETSPAQKRQYILHEILGDFAPYNLGAVYFVIGELQRDKFEKVIHTLVIRHEAFRTRFSIINDEIVQIIEDEARPIIEFEYSTKTELENQIAEFVKVFDLSKAPLFKVKLITLSDKEHILLIDMHHIIADQSSVAILVREFIELYSGKSLAPLTVQYKDFAAWQNALLHQPEIKNQLDYWKNEFKGDIPLLSFSSDFPRPAIQTFDGDRLVINLDSDISKKIESFSKQYELTPYMIFIAVFKLTLWKYSGQNDLIVGTAVAGRRHVDLHSIVGMFVNTLAIRSQIDDHLSVDAYLQYIKQKMIGAYDNQEYPFEQLIELLQIEKDSSRNPLFDVAINYLDLEDNELMIDSLSITPWPNTKVYSKFDMVWNIEKRGTDYFTEIEFNTSLFKLETMTEFSNRLVRTLIFVLNDTKLPLRDLCLLSASEKQLILYQMNQTTTHYPKHKNLVQLFEEQVEQRGDNTALIFNGEAFSYAELNNEANKVAQLLTEYNLQHGQYVAILLDRCAMQSICILGILKTGCAYIPIDPETPVERIHFILEDSGAQILLTKSSFEIASPIDVILLDLKEVQPQISQYQAKNITPQDSAYIIYTSGSTGTPKGVIVSHQNVVRLIKKTNYIEIKPEDKLLQLFNYAFDGAVFDIFGALLNGGCLVVAPKEAMIDMALLTDIIKQQSISILFTTTAQFNMLVDWDVTALSQVRKVLFGGELASIMHSKRALNFLGPDRLIHAYGPTEATVLATYYPINQLEENITSVPIGYPVSNCKIYILDKAGQPVPNNIPGELYIGGDAVAKGYLNRKELTESHFLRDPFNPGQIMYRTGDIACRLATNEIVFIGRQDLQIKIRGFRVELNEIKIHIRKITGIKDVIVTSQLDHQGGKYIAAYYTVMEEKISEEQVSRILHEKMPAHMVPTHIQMIQSIPLNTNGKVDLKVLPEIEPIQKYRDKPSNEIEDIILNEMKKLLGHDMGVKDDFFKCGGHSLKAIALVHALSKQGIKISVNEIFQNRTVECLANLPQLIAQNNNQETYFTVTHKVSLNDRQIQGLVEHAASASCFFSKILCSATEATSFPLSAQQLWQLMQGPMSAGFVHEINGDIQECSIRKRLTDIIKHNQLLHSTIQNDEYTPIWREHDIEELMPLIEKNVPYIDLRMFDQKTEEEIINQISMFIFTTPFQKSSLLWRMCCLRLKQDKHLIIWGFDHISFDGMSADIIRNQISNDLQDQQKYQDYVLQLKNGPNDITESKIIEEFSLKKWSKLNGSLMQKIEQISQNEITFELPLMREEHKTPWTLSFETAIKILREYFGIHEIPLGIVHYGRTYHQQNYYNCVGEFLDVVPILVKNVTEQIEISPLLETCKQHSINFISLFLDPDLSNSFSRIAQLLAPAFKINGEPQRFILFNFQGYIAKEEKQLLKNSLKKMEKKTISMVTINAHYDDDNVSIEISGLNGLSLNKAQEYLGFSEDFSKSPLCQEDATV